jgi:hypothetical protein
MGLSWLRGEKVGREGLGGEEVPVGARTVVAVCTTQHGTIFLPCCAQGRISGSIPG